jgi:hypothetical protein
MSNYQRTIAELQAKSLFWLSPELQQEVARTSPLALLTETFPLFYENCINSNTVDELIEQFEHENLPLHHNLKHLQVVTDVGGEILQRISSDAEKLFPLGKLNVVYRDRPLEIILFKPGQPFRISNIILDLDGKGLARSSPRKPELLKKTVKLLCLGKFSVDRRTSEILSKCDFADYLGDREILDRYLKTRYISVSRITTRSDTNALGQILQKSVKEKLEVRLKPYLQQLEITKNGLLLIDDRPFMSDILILNQVSQKAVGIEVSFQVTTNSTIERKANEAHTRFVAFSSAGHYTAYVLDGAGNFERLSACTKICNSSHCSVAYSESELDLLAEFVVDRLHL